MDPEQMLEQLGEYAARIGLIMNAAFLSTQPSPARQIYIATAAGLAMTDLATKAGMSAVEFDRLLSWLKAAHTSRVEDEPQKEPMN